MLKYWKSLTTAQKLGLAGIGFIVGNVLTLIPVVGLVFVVTNFVCAWIIGRNTVKAYYEAKVQRVTDNYRSPATAYSNWTPTR